VDKLVVFISNKTSDFLSLKKEALSSFEMSEITLYPTPEDLNLLYKYNQKFAKCYWKAST
jgi:hypothetical protein